MLSRVLDQLATTGDFWHLTSQLQQMLLLGRDYTAVLATTCLYVSVSWLLFCVINQARVILKEICHRCIVMDNVNRCEETDFPGPIKVINNCLLCLFLMTDASLVTTKKNPKNITVTQIRHNIIEPKCQDSLELHFHQKHFELVK